MNQDKDKNKNSFSKTLCWVRRWPIEKKRFFSISVAVFLTILIIILNSAFNIIWKDDTPKVNYAQNEAISSIKESFSNIFNTAAPALEQAFNSSSQIIDQINSTSSSLSTTTDVVR